jgi:diaminopimelate epimerase
MSIDTVAGILRAEARGDQVLLYMTEPTEIQLDQQLELAGSPLKAHVANTGVPHVVVPVDSVEDADVMGWGSAIRYHDRFAPAGTNANFLEVAGENRLVVRTYERGVEAETLACGTGVVACCVLAGLAGLVTAPVTATVRSGDELVVDYTVEEGRVTNVTLLGPAAHVFTGTLRYPEENH